MSIYNQFETDKNLETKGIELAYGESIFVVARAGGSNKKFLKLMDRKTRPHRRQVANGTIDEKVMKAIMIEVFAETVVLGWQNVQNRKGEFMDFKKENVVKLFTDLPDLFTILMQDCSNSALFLADIKEAEAGN